MYSLLIVDDDKEMIEITSANFRGKGYLVYTTHDSSKAVELFKNSKPDCVILDVMMPEMDGFGLCMKIREISSVPVIFLTGRVSEDDKVNGLILGADDYMEKPFSFRELEARVQAAIRRAAGSSPGKMLFPPLEIDIESHRALCDGEDLFLTSREYNILYMLAANQEKVLTYKDIGTHIWGVYREKDRRSVMVNVSRLRKKMEVNPMTAGMIETVWSTGYKFTGRRA